MFVNYTNDLNRTILVLRDFLKSFYIYGQDGEKKESGVIKEYKEVGIDSVHLMKLTDENDPDNLQGYFAIDKENKKVIIRITDTYYLRLTFELEDQDRIDFSEQYEVNGIIEDGIGIIDDRRNIYSVKLMKPAHAVVNKKLVHYELRGYNGDEDSIEMYYPCRFVEQKQYIIKRNVFQRLEINTYSFAKLPWNLQISSIIEDIRTAVGMKLRDWERKQEVNNYDRNVVTKLKT